MILGKDTGKRRPLASSVCEILAVWPLGGGVEHPSCASGNLIGHAPLKRAVTYCWRRQRKTFGLPIQTFQSGPFRAPRFLVPKHLGRKEITCAPSSSRRRRRTATSVVASSDSS